MKKYIRFVFATLISVVFLSSCIQEANPEGNTIVEEPTIEELLNGLPADL